MHFLTKCHSYAHLVEINESKHMACSSGEAQKRDEGRKVTFGEDGEPSQSAKGHGHCYSRQKIHHNPSPTGKRFQLTKEDI